VFWYQCKSLQGGGKSWTKKRLVFTNFRVVPQKPLTLGCRHVVKDSPNRQVKPKPRLLSSAGYGLELPFDGFSQN
jgi:hypothetical protein